MYYMINSSSLEIFLFSVIIGKYLIENTDLTLYVVHVNISKILCTSFTDNSTKI